MATFKVAHLREQGQDIIVVLVDSSFGCKTKAEQIAVCTSIHSCATTAGLAGTVVPVWDNGGGRMAFLAPQPWISFFKSLTLRDVAANINRELTCV